MDDIALVQFACSRSLYPLCNRGRKGCDENLPDITKHALIAGGVEIANEVEGLDNLIGALVAGYQQAVDRSLAARPDDGPVANR